MLKKLILVSVLVVLALGKKNVCKLKKGKQLITFSGTPEEVKFGCKFNMLKGTICGGYKAITVSPGLKLEKRGEKGYDYVVDSLFVTLTRSADDKDLQIRMDMQTVQNYLDDKRTLPINQKGGSLNISDVFTVTKHGKRKVKLTEKLNKDFTIDYKLFDKMKIQTSQVWFTCKSEFEPGDIPKQLCGEGERNEIKNLKKELDVGNNRNAAILHSIFTNQHIAQTDADCKAAAKKMSSTDCDKMDQEAARQCWRIFYDKTFTKRLYWGEKKVSPNTVFRSCVDFVCSNYTATSSCHELKGYLDEYKCPKLDSVSKKLTCG